MTKQEKLDEIALYLQQWLDQNEAGHKKDGNEVTDETTVYPPVYPNRRQLKFWIECLRETTRCIICDCETKRPIAAALDHFRLVEWGQWKYWKGNIQTFGFWSGLRGSVCLSFPIINTLLNWKYRKMTLKIPDKID